MPKKRDAIFTDAAASTLNRGGGGSLSSQGSLANSPAPAPAATTQKAAINAIPLAKILPDPYQSRGGVLPLQQMIPVYNGQLLPGDALEQWIAHLDDDPLYRLRYDELCDLAESIREHGLINPIHVYHPPLNVDSYRIESGERRYWAHWLLAREDPQKYANIRAIVESGFSVHRQVDENDDVSGLSTIGESRNIARLYLSELEILPASGPVDAQSLYQFYRKVTLPVVELIGQDYLPDGFWPKLTELTKKSRRTLNERLDVFKLPQPAIEIADAARINLLQIGEILRAEQDEVRIELTELAANYHLTGTLLRKLARLSVDNPAAYQQEVAILRGQATKEKRKQGTPLEVHTKRIYQAMRGLERLNEHEFVAIAERLIASDPQALPAVTESLEKLLSALRASKPKKG